MHLGPHLSEFVAACPTITDQNMLRLVLTDMTLALGFEQFSLNHHVDLIGPPADAVVLLNYHDDWIDTAFSKRYFVDDPIHAASMRGGIGFLWHDVPRILTLSQRQQGILAEARKFGLCDGITVPIHIPGEYRGTCSFAGQTLRETSVPLLGAAHLVGVFAFEAARRLVLARCGNAGPTPAIPQLSRRQLDCVALVACGKGDWEISRILNISKATAHQHVEEAMRRYNVCKRTQLVVRALFDGQICYRDTIAH